MLERIYKWIRKWSNKFIHSIAFLPAILAVVFWLLAILFMELDAAGLGTALNKEFKWLTLQDASTARTIVATVSAGIISLTVFSFSMVMIVMNQAASQMSNRMLDNIIGDRVQKLVLGFYVGTIVFSLFLLTNISEEGNPATVPNLSVYFLLLLTMIDIFLFIFFLHYITQSFRYEQLIQRIHKRTTRTLEKISRNKHSVYRQHKQQQERQLVLSVESGYFQGFAENQLLQLAKAENLVFFFMHPFGAYVQKGTPLLKVMGNTNDKCLRRILTDIDFYYGQEIDKNPYYGFYHLTEVAVKALSPGINDPGTAVLAIHALTDLFARLMEENIANTFMDNNGVERIITTAIPFDELFDCVVLPIWDYGNKDRTVVTQLLNMVNALLYVDTKGSMTDFLQKKKDFFAANEEKEAKA